MISTSDQADVEKLPDWETRNVANVEPLNNVRYINKFLEAVNVKLPLGGRFIGCVESAAQRRTRILNKFPGFVAHPYYAADFVLKRVLPKLWLTKGAYFALTKGRNRVFSKAEILGRLVACGFKIDDYREFNNKIYFVVTKTGAPAYDNNPSYGPVFKMRRVGEGGNPIRVYKLRTMHPYAEYLQEHVYEANKLDDNGKLKDDFRITSWGRFMRKCWLDELPMIINLLKGDMKIVGVRPISEHYLTLYPEDVKANRLKVKPGLLPPFYADLPKDFGEIIDSEARYLSAYKERPIRTDVQYLFKAVYNILIKRARSQ